MTHEGTSKKKKKTKTSNQDIVPPPRPLAYEVKSSGNLNELLAGNSGIRPDLRSVWNQSFHPDQHVDEHLLSNADVRLYQQLGGQQSGRTIQAYGLRLASLGRLLELEVAATEKQKSSLETEVESLKTKIADNMNHVNASMQVEQELSKVKGQLQRMTEEAANLNSLLSETNEKYSIATADLESTQFRLEEVCSTAKKRENDLIKEVKDMRMSLVKQHAVGFESAMKQVACIGPNFDFSRTVLAKEVRDGETVELPDKDKDEAEGGSTIGEESEHEEVQATNHGDNSDNI